MRVFYLSYLRAELVRRKGRTILTMLGLPCEPRVCDPRTRSERWSSRQRR
jgi:hypothetical protein